MTNCKIIAMAILIATSFWNCTSSSEKKSAIVNDNLVIFATDKVDILKSYPKTCINSNELKIVDSILNVMVLQYNAETKKHFDLRGMKYDGISAFINLNDYRRQLVTYRNEQNEKKVWIYFLNKEKAHLNWKEEFKRYPNEGEDFFDATLNITNKSVENFSLNK